MFPPQPTLRRRNEARPLILNTGTGGRFNRSDVLGGIVHEYERAA